MPARPDSFEATQVGSGHVAIVGDVEAKNRGVGCWDSVGVLVDH
jgi:hypothetical protein